MTPFEQVRADATDKATVYGSGRISFSDIETRKLYTILCVIPQQGDAPTYAIRLDDIFIHVLDFKEYMDGRIDTVNP